MKEGAESMETLARWNERGVNCGHMHAFVTHIFQAVVFASQRNFHGKLGREQGLKTDDHPH